MLSFITYQNGEIVNMYCSKLPHVSVLDNQEKPVYYPKSISDTNCIRVGVELKGGLQQF